MTKHKKRQFSRITFSREVCLDFNGSEHDCCQLKDLSLTGMYVFGSFDQKPGATCTVKLCQKGCSTVLEMESTAKVVWVNAEGIAIQFTSMAFDSYMFLQTTLLYEADDPLFIGLELPADSPFEIIDEEPKSTPKVPLYEDSAATYE